MCRVDAIQLLTERTGLGGQGEKERDKEREGLGERLILSMSTEKKKDFKICRPLEELKLCKMGLRKQQIKLLSFGNI